MAVWIAYGWWLRGRSDRLRSKLRATSRGLKVAYGSVGFLASGGLLLAGLYAIGQAGGMTRNGLTVWGWFAVLVLGLAFVHLQVLAAASMITLIQEGETTPPSSPSNSQQSSQNEQDPSA